jgi:thiol:disulfide interchange protein/DsbC/DsbD-like thiol-disulfide interchange protein
MNPPDPIHHRSEFRRTALRAAAAILAAWAVFAACPSAAQEHRGRTLVQARLVADTTAVVPGKPFEAGVLLEMAEGWHVYWENPGDAGIPTRVDWELPEGFTAGPLRWPAPQRIVEPGDIVVYGYKGSVLLTATIIPPAELDTPQIELAADVSWLVCEAICIPGGARPALDLPVQPTANPANADLFDPFRAQVPSDTIPPFDLTWTYRDGILELSGLPAGEDADLFPLPGEGAQAGHARAGAGTLAIETGLPFRGVLTVGPEPGRRSWSVGWNREEEPPPAPSHSLLQALFYGFLGGLILNLMPCVLPVISLKIFGFVRQAGDAPSKILRHGLAFTGGIFLWFFGLAVLVVAIKAAGGQATWAFQFQNPWFNLGISTVVFVFALNLFGVFEIVLPGRAATAVSDVSGGHGYSGSFFQGVFATLLATPCTAPFLGTALGFAFSQPATVIFAMFGAVSLGMASPYLVLSARPAWMKILPKPGSWMESVKQFMGFPLMATLVWLLAILGNQKGFEAVIWTLCFLLCLALACWIYGTFCGPMSSARTRALALLSATTITAGGSYLFIAVLFTGARPAAAALTTAASTDGIPWQPFTQKALDSLLDEGKGVFLDFTADWCISCKFNERTAIDRPAVRQALDQSGIIPMKADWTNSNPEITAALARFGRVGVPFYVIYPPGRPGEPIILPEILTEQMVLDALRKAGS